MATETTMLRDERELLGFAEGRHMDRARAFRGAARHSRRVRVLRVAIPVTVGLCLLVIVFATFFNPLRLLSRIPTDFGTLVVSGTRITMEAPRLAGFTRDARAYEVTAQAAAQDLTKPNLVELKEIHARMDMQNKTGVRLSAAAGVYDTTSEKLTLGPHIVLSSTTGYEGRLSEAVVDIRKGVIVSEKPVEVKMLKGNLNANRLEVLDAGDLVRFDAGVTMILNLEPSDYPQGTVAK